MFLNVSAEENKIPAVKFFFCLISVPPLWVQDAWLELVTRVRSMQAQGGCL